jgi:hypothetical protein
MSKRKKDDGRMYRLNCKEVELTARLRRRAEHVLIDIWSSKDVDITDEADKARYEAWLGEIELDMDRPCSVTAFHDADRRWAALLFNSPSVCWETEAGPSNRGATDTLLDAIDKAIEERGLEAFFGAMARGDEL